MSAFAAAADRTTTTANLRPRGETTPQVRSLDRLLALDTTELETLYRQASTPRLEDVGGDLRGRMLAWPSLAHRPLLQGALRSFASTEHAFPWRGKSFTPPVSARVVGRGHGINRVIVDRVRLFRFETFLGKSKAGDFDALHLDYDLPGNPPVIRSIQDEIRELEPGLWLGQAYLHTSRRDLLWLYFGLARAES